MKPQRPGPVADVRAAWSALHAHPVRNRRFAPTPSKVASARACRRPWGRFSERHSNEGHRHVSPAGNVVANAIGWLQEHAQKSRWQLPEYSFKTLSEVPPRFQATVMVYGAKPGRYTGEATTKQEAKKKAAEAAVKGAKA